MMSAQQNKVQTFDVFCGGIAEWVTKSMMEAIAREFNPKKVKVLFNSTGSHKNGFITFWDVESAKAFIATYNGTDPLGCGLEFVARFADGKSNGRKKVHVGKLSHDCTEEDLHNLGQAFGNVLSVKLLANQACGFITFSTQQEAQACINGCQNTTYTVQFAKSGARQDQRTVAKQSNRTNNNCYYNNQYVQGQQYHVQGPSSPSYHSEPWSTSGSTGSSPVSCNSHSIESSNSNSTYTPVLTQVDQYGNIMVMPLSVSYVSMPMPIMQ